jgi:hypothetical protein
MIYVFPRIFLLGYIFQWLRLTRLKFPNLEYSEVQLSLIHGEYSSIHINDKDQLAAIDTHGTGLFSTQFQPPNWVSMQNKVALTSIVSSKQGRVCGIAKDHNFYCTSNWETHRKLDFTSGDRYSTVLEEDWECFVTTGGFVYCEKGEELTEVKTPDFENIEVAVSDMSMCIRDTSFQVRCTRDWKSNGEWPYISTNLKSIALRGSVLCGVDTNQDAIKCYPVWKSNAKKEVMVTPSNKIKQISMNQNGKLCAVTQEKSLLCTSELKSYLQDQLGWIDRWFYYSFK